MSAWEDWIGREEMRRDYIDESSAARWLATFDRSAANDGTVPQGCHWCLCLPDAPTATLGSDGHPRRDERAESFLPPIPLPRRMWAASRVSFVKPLRADQSIVRNSRVASIKAKQGGSGALVFVDVEHATHADGELAILETQSIVFRDAAPKGTPPAPPPLGEAQFDPAAWHAHRALVPTEALLFRYSALTFNSHRIHYDRRYATDEEGYRGLVVHGPLTATLLLGLAQAEFGDNALSHFDFRGTSPAIVGEELHLVMRETAKGMELGAFARDGRQVMTASARRTA